MYSQNNEEEILEEVFKDLSNGKFLDVGAFDGKTFSNTYRLFERGWTGVCVEPSPKAFAGLERNYAKTQGVELVQAAVTGKDGKVELFDSGGDAISSTNEKHTVAWIENAGCSFEKISVPAITFETLFKYYGSDYNFLNIDTESTNMDVLSLFPFDKCKPECVCIEHDNMFSAMEDILLPLGYKEVARNGENLIVRREC